MPTLGKAPMPLRVRSRTLSRFLFPALFMPIISNIYVGCTARLWMSQTSSNQSDGDGSSIAFLTQIMYSLPGQSAHRQASATCGIIPNPSTIKNWSCEMLQVTCRPLPTTRRPLPVSRRPPATCHLSPVTHHCRWSPVARTDHNAARSQLSPLPPNTTPSHVARYLSPTNTNTNRGAAWPPHHHTNHAISRRSPTPTAAAAVETAIVASPCHNQHHPPPRQPRRRLSPIAGHPPLKPQHQHQQRRRWRRRTP